MIFFATGDGTIIKTLPTPVYQGSENASEIYLIAPFSPNLKVTVRFQLPSGVWTTPALMRNGMPTKDAMTAQGALASADGAIIDKETCRTYAVWSYALPSDITSYYGTVTAQFFFYAAQGGVVTSTSAANFTVGRGVPTVLPDAPTEDVYEAILSNLSALQEQLDNGTYTARSIYAWNSSYTYGAGEIVFYPDKGEYGVFVKSLVSGNKAVPYVDGKLSENWEEVVDFNTLNSLYSLRDDLNEAIQNADEITQRAEDVEQSANSSAQSAASSAAESEASAKRVEDAAVYLESIRDGIEAVPKSVADETGKNIAEQFSDINEKIPSAASAENQLADKAFVNSSINNSAAFYITFNANGDAFPTRADLLNATTFYSGGKERVPTQNDYAIVLADENQPQGVDGKYPTTRYSYQGGTYPDGQWNFQYVVNNTSLTQEQVDAINSGITKDLVSNIFPPNTSVPLMDGVSSAGNSNNYARGDHRHPTDTTRASTAVATQTSNGLMSSADKIKLDEIGGSSVTGVKGKAETTYRTGNVNLTAENIGAATPTGTYPDMTVGNATKAQSADTLANARAIDGVSFNGSAAITHYGVCSTTAGTTAKTVSLTGFTLVTGARITVKFTTANTVSSPTLIVNGTPAKAMKCKDRTTGLAWKAGELMTLVYDGTNWCIVEGYSLADRPVNAHHIQYNGEETPAARFGGTWQIDTDYTGRVLVGSGTGYTLGATGGSSTHNHDLSNVIACMARDYENYPELIYLSKNSPSADGYTGNRRVKVAGYEDDNVSRYESTGIAVQGVTDLGDTMQPYKVVGVWKRTA